MDLLWPLNLADGHHGLLDMAIRADIPSALLQAAAGRLTHARTRLGNLIVFARELAG
jgi:aminopeptidase-like protein